MESKHTFIKGLNRDISKDKFPNDAYYYLLNGRVLASDDATMSDIVNIKGNTSANINDNAISRVGYSIIGYTVMRNDIILFYAESTATGVDSASTTSKIDKLIYLGNDAYSRAQLWSGVGLNFRIDKPIKAVSKYESNLVQKIYWTDDNNSFRHANIASSISSQVATQFDLNGDLNGQPSPYFSDYTSGSLKPGSITYAVRFIKKNGYRTVFSTTSNMICLGSNINSGQIIRRAYGDEIYDKDRAFNTNKGVILGFDIINSNYLTFYDYIEVVSLWYSSDSAIPDINIIQKISIDPSKPNYRIIDTGTTSYGTLTYEEFLSQDYSFSAKDIVTKDNRLFVGNITEEYFDIDIDATWTGKSTGDIWDARAYRFDYTGQCELCSDDINTVQYTLMGPTPNYTIVTPIANAINRYNKVTVNIGDENNTGVKQQKYQADGTTYGGSGLNISYTFQRATEYLMSAAALSPSLDGVISNPSQLGIIRGYQRGEVYRFGVVFYDLKGRQSFVKWIGDIRISKLGEIGGDYVTSEDASFNITSSSAYPYFLLTNCPSINGIYLDWQIVHVKREEADKGVVAAGMLTPNQKVNVGTRPYASPKNITTYQATADANPGMNKHSFNFISPEINLREKESLNYSFFEIAGDLTSKACIARNYNLNTWVNWTPTSEISQSNNIYIRRLTTCSTASNYSRVNVNSKVKVIPPTTINFSIVNDVDTYYPSFYVDYDNGHTISAPHGTCFVNRLANIISAPIASAGYFYAYARKDVFTSQYGGLTYNNRQANIYLPASPLVKGESYGTTAICIQGDTFSTIFEYGKYFFQISPQNFGPTEMSSGDHTYIGCESSINCLYRTKDTYSRKHFVNPPDIAQINENPYVNLNTGVTLTELYGYNSAYNKMNDSRKFFPKPFLFNQIETFPNRLKYSDLKIENEDIDSWLVYRTNNYKTANEAYGPLNKLIEFQDKVFSLQDNAFALVSINPRVTQQSPDGVMIVLGNGEIIDKFHYLSTDIGCQDNSDVIGSISAIYWLDKNKKKIYSFNGQLETLTDLKGMQSYLYNNITENSIFIGSYDISNSEVLMTVRDSNPNTIFRASVVSTDWNLTGVTSAIEIPFVVGRVYKIGAGYFTYVSKTATTYRFTYSHGTNLTAGNDYDLVNYINERDNFTIAYSEKLQAFTSFYSFVPTLYIYHHKGFFSSINNNSLYQHNISTQYNTFYGTTYPTTIKLITNFGAQGQAEYTNVKFFSEIRDIYGNLKANETVSNIQLKDPTQVSEDVILYPIHLVEEGKGTRYVLDTSGLRLGKDWYTGLSTPVEGLVVNNNELYRNNAIIALTTSPPATGWGVAELCNIRKTNNQWHTQLPRFVYKENNSGNPDYTMSNRFRSDWLEVTLEFKDMLPGINLYDRKFKISDITLTSTPLQF